MSKFSLALSKIHMHIFIMSVSKRSIDKSAMKALDRSPELRLGMKVMASVE